MGRCTARLRSRFPQPSGQAKQYIGTSGEPDFDKFPIRHTRLRWLTNISWRRDSIEPLWPFVTAINPPKSAFARRSAENSSPKSATAPLARRHSLRPHSPGKSPSSHSFLQTPHTTIKSAYLTQSRSRCYFESQQPAGRLTNTLDKERARGDGGQDHRRIITSEDSINGKHCTDD